MEHGHTQGEKEANITIKGERLRLTKLMDSDDIEAYLTTFERMMGAHEVDCMKWAYLLAPQLTGKAQKAYATM